MKLNRWILSLATCTALLVGADGASAATTFGSTLVGNEPSFANQPTTLANQDLDATHEMPAGIVVPSDGVIVRWRIRVGAESAGQTAALRVIRKNIGHGKSLTEDVPTAPGTYEYSTRLPVTAGDQIGVDASSLLEVIEVGGGSDVHWEYWIPPLAEGGSTATPPTPNQADAYIQLNADVEPDADGDGYGDETQDLCPTDRSRQGDCNPPDTTITSSPAAKSSNAAAQLVFSSTEVGSTFECSFDGTPFAGCLSPTIKTVGIGPHFFQVRATDVAGNVDQSPAIASWEVVKKHKKHKKHHKHHHHGHGHG